MRIESMSIFDQPVNRTVKQPEFACHGDSEFRYSPANDGHKANYYGTLFGMASFQRQLRLSQSCSHRGSAAVAA